MLNEVVQDFELSNSCCNLLWKKLKPPYPRFSLKNHPRGWWVI